MIITTTTTTHTSDFISLLLVFLKETTSGSLNSMDRKHASIRYETATDTFEVELQDVPAIFEVSHATGR